MLRYAKEMMGNIPVALEFRNQTWFSEEMTEKTVSFIKEEGWIHTVCDEPQAGTGSIPIVLHATQEKHSYVCTAETYMDGTIKVSRIGEKSDIFIDIMMPN